MAAQGGQTGAGGGGALTPCVLHPTEVSVLRSTVLLGGIPAGDPQEAHGRLKALGPVPVPPALRISGQLCGCQVVSLPHTTRPPARPLV